MFAKVIGTIEGIYPAASGKVYRIKVTAESNGKTFSKIITCWDQEYTENINILTVGNKVIIECLLKDRYLTSNCAAYIEGHEKEGQWFEYHTLEPYLITAKHYQASNVPPQAPKAPKAPSSQPFPRAPKPPKAPNPFKRDVEHSDLTLDDIFPNED